jgi:hypothetical protein
MNKCRNPRKGIDGGRRENEKEKKEKKETHQFTIQPTSITIQLIVQTSPPKRCMSSSTIHTFTLRS